MYFVGVIFIDWFKNVFIPSVRERRLEEGEKVLLLLDNAPCHPSTEVLNSIDPQFKVYYLPPKVTSILQPMDQGVIECMKRHYKGIFLKKLVISDTESPTAIETFLKNWNLLDTAQAVANAWSSVSPSILSKSWKKLLGEVTLPENNETEMPSLANLLRRIHPSNAHSADEIEEWVQEDSNISAWRKLSDRELLDKSYGENLEVCNLMINLGSI